MIVVSYQKKKRFLSNILTSIVCAALQLEVELSRQHHDGDLKEKNRLARMLENKVSFN